MKISLRELQENFQAYVLDENNNVLSHISTQQSSAIERIDIYKKGYALRLLEVLEKDFPILRQKLGEAEFEEIGREYINAHPSDHFNICTFSRHFSEFLLKTKNDAFLAEMAVFEWALACALDAADASQIGIADLSSVQPESWPYIQFDFHPSVVVHQFHFNAPQVVYALMLEKDSIPEPTKEEMPKEWVIWRFELQSYFESLTKEQVWMVNAIRQKKTFAEICQGLCQWLPEEEVAMFAAGSLRNWLEKGLFSAIHISEPVESLEQEEVVAVL